MMMMMMYVSLIKYVPYTYARGLRKILQYFQKKYWQVVIYVLSWRHWILYGNLRALLQLFAIISDSLQRYLSLKTPTCCSWYEKRQRQRSQTHSATTVLDLRSHGFIILLFSLMTLTCDVDAWSPCRLAIEPLTQWRLRCQCCLSNCLLVVNYRLPFCCWI